MIVDYLCALPGFLLLVILTVVAYDFRTDIGRWLRKKLHLK